MSRNENVDNAIWQDSPFADLSHNGKLTYLWSWTNQLCGMAGLYKARAEQIQLDTAQTKGMVESALEELREQGMLYAIDGVVWVVARVPRLVTQTPQIAKSIAKDVARVPAAHPLRETFLGWFWETKWPGGGLRDRFESEGHPRVTRGSVEGHEKPYVIEEILRVTRGSLDPLLNSASVSAVSFVVPPPAVARDVELPELPGKLAAVAVVVVETLARVAAFKMAKPNAQAAIYRVLLDFADHDHRKLVAEFEHYWCFGAGEKTKRSDIVLTYRRRLENVVARPPASLSSADFVKALNG